MPFLRFPPAAFGGEGVRFRTLHALCPRLWSWDVLLLLLLLLLRGSFGRCLGGYAPAPDDDAAAVAPCL